MLKGEKMCDIKGKNGLQLSLESKGFSDVNTEYKNCYFGIEKPHHSSHTRKSSTQRTPNRTTKSVKITN